MTLVNPPLVMHVTTVDLGMRYLLLEQLKFLHQQGYVVEGICTEGPQLADVRQAGIIVTPVTMTRRISPLQDLGSIKNLLKVFRQRCPTIVHTHNPKPGLVAQFAAKLAGVPIVIHTLHGFYFHDGSSPMKRRFFMAVEYLSARFSDVILSENREDVATAIREGICHPWQIMFIGNGINIAHFNQQTLKDEHQAALRAELGIPDDALVIGAVGRLVAEKGYHELFAAFRDLAQTRPNLHLLVVGPEEPAKADGLTAQTAVDYGIADRTHFVGLRHDMPEMYGLMDVLAHASYREGFPRAPMEAAAMGIPVVATDIRGCREAIFDRQNGILVRVKNAAALAQGLARLLDDSTLRHAMGTLGRRIAVREFDEQVVFERVLATYKELEFRRVH